MIRLCAILGLPSLSHPESVVLLAIGIVAVVVVFLLCALVLVWNGKAFPSFELGRNGLRIRFQQFKKHGS